jgi:short-subunit dehydrogenase
MTAILTWFDNGGTSVIQAEPGRGWIGAILTAFRNQVAVVTGASGGIGSAISEALARREAALLITGRDGVKLTAEAERLRAFTASVEWFACDLTKDDAVEELCDLVSEKHDRLDILVHCAGVIDHGKLADAPLTSLDRQYRANVRGPLLLTQRLLPLLKRPKGQIVFVNSSAGLKARANAGHFAATQHALKAAADALREEVNPDGLRVLSVFPGRTATPRISALHALQGRPFEPELLLQPADVASVVLNALSLPWTAEVTNVSIRPMQKFY